MKIIKTILVFMVALLVLSSYAVKQNDLFGSDSESSNSIGQTAVMDEAYKELTKDTNTITVNGIPYRNKFQGDLIYNVRGESKSTSENNLVIACYVDGRPVGSCDITFFKN